MVETCRFNVVFNAKLNPQISLIVVKISSQNIQITDNFNLHGLREKVGNFKDAMTMIMRSDSPDSEDLNDP